MDHLVKCSECRDQAQCAVALTQGIPSILMHTSLERWINVPQMKLGYNPFRTGLLWSPKGALGTTVKTSNWPASVTGASGLVSSFTVK